MKKYNFLLNSFRNSSLKSLYIVSKKVKQKCNKKFIVLDMIYCAIKYQAAFYDYLEFEFYSLNKEQRKTYLTSGKNNEIIKKFNNKNYWDILDDKSKFNEQFKKYINREYLKPYSTEEEFNNFIKHKDKIIIKPINGIGGDGIKIINTNNCNYWEIKKYLIEDVIIQNKELADLYDKSVNTIRIFTFCDGQNSYLLQAILKIGNNSITDNFSSGGMYAFLDEKGIVITPAIDKDDNNFEIHPISKKQILGFKVPLFDDAVELVLKASKEIPQIGYIGWDVAISKKYGPLLIEGNSYPAQDLTQYPKLNLGTYSVMMETIK